MSYHDEIGLGGFFLENIKKWIIKECIESGDPENFFNNMLDVIDDLDDDRSWMFEADE